MSKAKRPTKAQAREREIAALEKRLRDIALGAHGAYNAPALDGDDEFIGMSNSLGLEALARWIGGIRNALNFDIGGGCDPAGRRDFLTGISVLHHYDSIREAAEWLHEQGVRA